MSSEEKSMLQRNAFVAAQQLKIPSAQAALQMQRMQDGQLQRESALTAEGQPAVIGEQYLVFSLADRELAVKAELVQGVERLTDLTPVPNVVPWVRGVINLRGSIVSVVDLRMFLDLEPLPHTSRTRLLSLQHNDMVICLIVDSVSEMLPIPAAAIISGNVRQASIQPWVSPYAAGCALFPNRLLVLLDAARLLFSEKMQRYEALG